MGPTKPATLSYANRKGDSVEDSGFMRRLGLLAMACGITRAAGILAFRFLEDRGAIDELLTGRLDYLHGFVWPPIIYGAMILALIGFSVGAALAYFQRSIGLRIVRIGGWAVVVVFGLNMIEEVAVSFAAQKGWASIGAGKRYGSSLGLAGLGIWRLGTILPDIVIPIATLAVTWTKRKIVNDDDLVRAARWLLAVAFTAGGAAISIYVVEEFSTFGWLRWELKNKPPDWLLKRGPDILHDGILVLSAVFFIFGAVPAMLLKNKGRCVVVVGSWATVAVVVLRIFWSWARTIMYTAGMGAPVEDYGWSDAGWSILYQLNTRMPTAILPLTLILFLSRPSLRARFY